ncbi:MAG: hypothetical protein TRG1_3209 [Flavobacteriaceae bacterium FS1-H7996/R]|nr:MAG: hypothetical protein TRG1_3209 [Flavobacteriaceae bacterium FS1-H7996/R]
MFLFKLNFEIILESLMVSTFSHEEFWEDTEKINKNIAIDKT